MTDPFVPDDEPEPAPPLEAETPAVPAPEPEGESAVSVIDALSYGWTTFRENVRPLLVVVAIPIVAQLVLAIAERVLVDSVAKWFLLQAVGIVVSTVAGIGEWRLALMLTAGETPDVARAFRYDRWGPWIAFSVVFGLLEGVGLVLCVIPGVLFLAYFGLAPYFFLDRGLGVGAALRASREAVVANGLAFAVLFALVVGALGVVLFFVGVFVTQAVATLALAFLYRHVTGEPVREPAGEPVGE